ncbi:hypothetical protein EJB05_07855, partial [Eragrostis curvula]
AVTAVLLLLRRRRRRRRRRIGECGGRAGVGRALKAHALGDYSVANEELEDQAQVLAAPSATLAGHGGTEAARFVNARLFSLVQEFATENGGLSADVLTKAFGATEEEFLGVGGTLYVANLADSRAVLGRRNSNKGRRNRVVAERLSRDHNVADEDLRREVAEMHPDDSRIVLNSHGVWRIKDIIQVSRSIGDAYLKKPNLCSSSSKGGGNGNGNNAILQHYLTDEAASPRKGVAMRLVRAAHLEVARKKEMRYETIQKAEKGYRRRFHDDITVVVLFLDTCNGAAQSSPDSIDSTYAPIDVYSYSPGGDQEDPTRPVLH